MRIYLFVFLSFCLVGCQVSKGLNQSSDFEYSARVMQGKGALKGSVVDPENRDPVPFAKVYLDSSTYAVVTDVNGVFYLENIAPGIYDLVIESVGYRESRISGVELKKDAVLEIKTGIPLTTYEDVLEKPMIYLYPDSARRITVDLNYKGHLTNTYPKSDGQWIVDAETDGTLTDTRGKKYYGLFWEGVPDKPILPHLGTVVARDSLVSFLEASLEQLGLNFRESNEFMVYWLPRLEKSPYNLIYFAGEDYTSQANLSITPKPDNVIRVMMGYVPLKAPIEIKPQELPEKPRREGFTVVEWGGTQCNLPSL